MLTEEEARRAITREWYNLPTSARQTREQAAIFAMEIRDKYPFPAKIDRYQIIKGWLDLAPLGKQHLG